jgi:hypothetical protein
MLFVTILALAAAAPASVAAPIAKAAQADATPLNVPQPAGASRPAVDQISLPAAPAPSPRTNVSQIAADEKTAERVKDAPESAIGEVQQSPEQALYEQIAQVWTTIRKRGQQPTPELIAREIGPDQLTKFLGQIPDASKIFGVDSDKLPLARPGEEAVPLGAGIIIQPAQGS